MKLSYDLHTHILPGIDDGAKTPEEALILIDSLRNQGINHLCFTPHFYTHKEAIEDFLVRREEAKRQFLSLVPDDVQVKVGAEVYVTKYLFSEERDLRALCIEDTNYMITEFSYDSTFSDNTMRMITYLRDRGIFPIIPHVERYPHLMKNKDKLLELIYGGVLIQSNAVSFTKFSSKRKLLRMVRDGYIQLLSSDTHSMTRNTPVAMTEAIKFISDKCGVEPVNSLIMNAEKVFYGK